MDNIFCVEIWHDKWIPSLKDFASSTFVVRKQRWQIVLILISFTRELNQEPLSLHDEAKVYSR